MDSEVRNLRVQVTMIRPPGIESEAGNFVVSPDSVWVRSGFAPVFNLCKHQHWWLVSSPSYLTQIDCALVLTLEANDNPEHGDCCHYFHYQHDFVYVNIIAFIVFI